MAGNAGAAARPRHNLPAALTSLVGRATELAGIAEALRRSRLVTLTGPGGVGKTHLALELARRQVGRRADGVWLVDLAAGTHAPDVGAEVARTLGVGRRGTTWTDALVHDVAERDLLLVLDNCEHVVAASAELAVTVLASCPDVRIMATSREVLDLPGERVWRLAPLDAGDARRLFVERARARRPEFMPDERAEETITRICERLDRLPLAIELAAARRGVMSVPRSSRGSSCGWASSAAGGSPRRAIAPSGRRSSGATGAPDRRAGGASRIGCVP